MKAKDLSDTKLYREILSAVLLSDGTISQDGLDTLFKRLNPGKHAVDGKMETALFAIAADLTSTRYLSKEEEKRFQALSVLAHLCAFVFPRCAILQGGEKYQSLRRMATQGLLEFLEKELHTQEAARTALKTFVRQTVQQHLSQK